MSFVIHIPRMSVFVEKRPELLSHVDVLLSLAEQLVLVRE